jgi:hypothetical protein
MSEDVRASYRAKDDFEIYFQQYFGKGQPYAGSTYFLQVSQGGIDRFFNEHINLNNYWGCEISKPLRYFQNLSSDPGTFETFVRLTQSADMPLAKHYLANIPQVGQSTLLAKLMNVDLGLSNEVSSPDTYLISSGWTAMESSRIRQVKKFEHLSLSIRKKILENLFPGLTIEDIFTNRTPQELELIQKKFDNAVIRFNFFLDRIQNDFGSVSSDEDLYALAADCATHQNMYTGVYYDHNLTAIPILYVLQPGTREVKLVFYYKDYRPEAIVDADFDLAGGLTENQNRDLLSNLGNMSVPSSFGPVKPGFQLNLPEIPPGYAKAGFGERPTDWSMGTAPSVPAVATPKKAEPLIPGVKALQPDISGMLRLPKSPDVPEAPTVDTPEIKHIKELIRPEVEKFMANYNQMGNDYSRQVFTQDIAETSLLMCVNPFHTRNLSQNRATQETSRC